MGIKRVNNIEELTNAINNYSKEVKTIIVIAMKQEVLSVTLNYKKGILEKVTCANKHGIDYSKLEVELFEMAPKVITELTDIESTTIFGYGYEEDNVLLFDFTDLDLESQQIEYYADKLEILKAWGINTTNYQRIERKDINAIITFMMNNNKHNIFVIAEKKKNLQEFDSDFPISVAFKINL